MIDDLLKEAERDVALQTPAAKAQAVAAKVRPADLRDVVAKLATMIFAQRQIRLVVDEVPASPTPRTSRPSVFPPLEGPAADLAEDAEFLASTGVGAIEAAERLGFNSWMALEKWLEQHKRYPLWQQFRAAEPVTSSVHQRVKKDAAKKAVSQFASPKILAARKAWDDWLATEVTMPDTGQQVALRDMTSDTLRKVADALFDAHEQVHRLATAVDQAGVKHARDLPPDAARLVLAAA